MSLWPRGPLHAAPTGSDDQDNVAVVAFAFGDIGRNVYASASLWAFAASVHALGRLAERDPRADVGHTLLAGHRALLAGNRDKAIAEHKRLLIPTPSGAFLAHLVRVTWRGSDAGMLTIADTWVHADMLHDAQRDSVLLPAADHCDMLGDDLMLLLPEGTRSCRR